MKQLLTFFVFMAFSAIVFAQQNYRDVVYLKNGSIIHGTIIEQVPDKSLKIETADKNVFVYQINEIDILKKEPIKGKNFFVNNGTGIKKGFEGRIETGPTLGFNGGEDAFKLNVIRGYCFNPYLSVGLGTGLRYYYGDKAALIPVFADFRANFLNNKVTPYMSFDIGYSFDTSDDFKGAGIYLNPCAGVSFKISDKSFMNVGIGFEMQKRNISLGSYYADYYYHFAVDQSAISINVGVSF